MSDTPIFTLRPVEGKPSEILDGEFRVYLHPEDLKQLRLNPGDRCLLSTTDGTSGVGIAWRSINANARRIVKSTHSFKDAYGFKIGDKLSISKYDGEWRQVKSVWVREVSDSSIYPVDMDALNFSIKCKLCEVAKVVNEGHKLTSSVTMEALWPGGHFDVELKTGNQRNSKRRFAIENIEAAGSVSVVPYTLQHDSIVHVSNGAQTATAVPSQPPSTVEEKPIQIDFAGIGGLDRQLKELNDKVRAMAQLIDQSRASSRAVRLKHPSRVLLYGASGTGKTLVLDRVKQAGFRGVGVIDTSIKSLSKIKGEEEIQNVFAKATSQQPSVVAIDDLHLLAGKQDHDLVSECLASEIRKLGTSQVIVVATANSPNDITASLRPHFRVEIELPIPDSKSRTEILRVLWDGALDLIDGAILATVGDRTHGYVGRDLEQLSQEALDIADRRWDQTHSRQENDGLVNGALHEEDQLTKTGPEAQHTSNHAEDFQVLLSDYEQALLKIKPTAMREIFFEIPKVRWSDIGGSESVKAALSKVYERPFAHPEIKQRFKNQPSRGILLYGPPGCSKTLTAKAMATSSGLNFLAVKGAELTSMYVGETERNIREVFRKARNASPSVIFFDEIDAIAASRGIEGGRGDGGTPGLNVLTTLLTEMDGVETLNSVLVLAATNRPDILDPALLRPGRFDAVLYVAPPPMIARREILEINTRGRPLDGVDLDEVSRTTEGYSGAEIVAICNFASGLAEDRAWEAAGQGLSIEDVFITMDDFMEAVSRQRTVITPETLERYENWGKKMVGIGMERL